MRLKILLIGSSKGIGLGFPPTRWALELDQMGHMVVVLSDTKERHSDLPVTLAKAGIKRYTSNSIDKSDMFSILKTVRVFETIYGKEGDFDIIHALGVGHVIKIYIAKKLLNLHSKIIVNAGYLPNSNLGVALVALLHNLLADRTITLCNYTKLMLEKWGLNSKKAAVIPINAPNLNQFDQARRKKISLKRYGLQQINKPVVFYAHRHIPCKGFEYYLKAASIVLKKVDTTFVVGGQGPLSEPLKRLARQLGIHEQVIFTGWINKYHMPYILSNITDVCVSTSLVEQLPKYVMECMAAGKPVVASNVGGVPEIVIDDLNGYAVPPRDYEETACRIMELLSEPKKAKEMGLAGRTIVERQLCQKISMLKLVKAYDGVLHG